MHLILNIFFVTLIQVVANSEMYRDATNLYRFKFTRVMDYDFSKAFDLFDQWYAGVQEKLKNDQIADISQKIQVNAKKLNRF